VSVEAARPFYGRFAWAYDLLSARPVAAECAHIASMIDGRGLPADARVLDAGCGTGRYAVELARLGYRVTGLDASAALLAVAGERPGAAAVTFVPGDLTVLPASADYDVILCRGVLNDLIDDRVRQAAFVALAGVLASGGALVCDVRDWAATVLRKSGTPVHEKTVSTARGVLTFRSETRLEPATRQLRISEQHRLTAGDRTIRADYSFVMRCWTRDELDGVLSNAGFADIAYRGAYDPAVPAGATDRLVVTATRT
jgi:SAM-dependent methyltransferase